VVDEAGQIALGSLSLVMGALSPVGRLIVAGDSEQLAPILSAQYPQSREQCLFGSVLDLLMQGREQKTGKNVVIPTASCAAESVGSSDDLLMSQGTVIQLTENFRFVSVPLSKSECNDQLLGRLNPDLGEFISTIYSRQFKSQKFQAKHMALRLQQAEEVVVEHLCVSKAIYEAVRLFLVSLSSVMLWKPQEILHPPRLQLPVAETTGIITDLALSHQPISLALIRLRMIPSDHMPYEMHVHGEAAVAASLVEFIRKCSPHDDIFVATPHRIQREAVRNVLEQSRRDASHLDEAFGNLKLHSMGNKVTVDTIERLQGILIQFLLGKKLKPYLSKARRLRS